MQFLAAWLRLHAALYNHEFPLAIRVAQLFGLQGACTGPKRKSTLSWAQCAVVSAELGSIRNLCLQGMTLHPWRHLESGSCSPHTILSSRCSRCVQISVIAALFLAASCTNADTAAADPAAATDAGAMEGSVPEIAGWDLVYANQFDCDAAKGLDGSMWEVQLGNGEEYGLPPGWGNDEPQIYSAECAPSAAHALPLESLPSAHELLA